MLHEGLGEAVVGFPGLEIEVPRMMFIILRTAPIQIAVKVTLTLPVEKPIHSS
jgi:hypothetical protein